MQHLKKSLLSLVFILGSATALFAQDDMLGAIENSGEKPVEYANNAFKSSRVINGHSMEFIGAGVLDVRILHRFGFVNSGAENLWGLDKATMRFGFDYGINKDLTIGVGRCTYQKEFDGFIKYRPIQQHTGGKHPFPVSIVLVSGATIVTDKNLDIPNAPNYVADKMAFYNQVIIGRKFSDAFSFEIAPTLIHLNMVKEKEFKNDIFALGFGARYKFTKRTAFVVDYHHVFGDRDNAQFADVKDPLSIGLDIETGGHVFQLHFSNAEGMNEKAFITNTRNSWGKGEISFGFNLSRVFTIVEKKSLKAN